MEDDELSETLDKLDHLVQIGDQAGMVSLFDEAIVRFGRRYELFYHRAQARCVAGDHAGALSDIDLALSLQPLEPALYFFRGLWRVNSGAISEGVRDLGRALELEESGGTNYYSSSSLMVRAVGYLLLGEFEACLRDCGAVEADMVAFVRGKLWRVPNVRALAIKGLR